MLYSRYGGYLYAVSSETLSIGSVIGKAEGSADLVRCYKSTPRFFPGFIQGLTNEATEEYNKKQYHELYESELLPQCPYVWSVLHAELFAFYWNGEKNTRVYVAAPDDEEDYLISVGAVKISGEEKNEAPLSLWYYSSDDPVLPEHFTKYPYVWQDLLTEEDFYWPEDELDEEDRYVEDTVESFDVDLDYLPERPDTNTMLDDPFEDVETAQDYYDDLVPYAYDDFAPQPYYVDDKPHIKKPQIEEPQIEETNNTENTNASIESYDPSDDEPFI